METRPDAVISCRRASKGTWSRLGRPNARRWNERLSDRFGRQNRRPPALCRADFERMGVCPTSRAAAAAREMNGIDVGTSKRIQTESFIIPCALDTTHLLPSITKVKLFGYPVRWAIAFFTCCAAEISRRVLAALSTHDD